MITKTLRAASLVAALVISSQLSSSAASAGPHGFYVLLDPKAAANDGGRIPPDIMQDMKSDAVAGVSIRVFLADVEPAEGKYNWSLIDGPLNAVREAGKEATLRVVAGAHTPSWVYDAGAQSFTYKGGNRHAGVQGPQKMPIPWDSVYLSKLGDFVRAFGARYAGDSAVKLVYMTGPVSTTNETFLPHDRAARDQWRQVGYSPLRYDDAWQQVIDDYAAAFPMQCLGIDLHVPLDPKDGAADGVLAYGERTLGKRFCVQHDGLSAKDDSNWAPSRQVLDARDKGATLGYQLLCGVADAGSFNDEGARFGGSGDDAQKMQQALQKAVDEHAHYVEVYPQDFKEPSVVDIFRQYKDRLAQ